MDTNWILGNMDKLTWNFHLDNKCELPRDDESKGTTSPTATTVARNNPFKVVARDIFKLLKSNVQDQFLEWHQTSIGQVKLAGCGALVEETFQPPSKSVPDCAHFLKQDKWLLHFIIQSCHARECNMPQH